MRAYALLRKELLLALERLGLALELKAVAIADLFEQSGDSLGLFVVHAVSDSAAKLRSMLPHVGSIENAAYPE